MFITDPQLLLAMPAVTDFVTAARAFCEWADAAPGDAASEARTAQRLLVRLYACGLELPTNVDSDGPEPDDPPETRYKQLHQRFGSLPLQYYWIEMEPSVITGRGERGCGDLCDDLADICLDLSCGLASFDSGHVLDSVWQWAFLFESHWGAHAIDALWILERWTHGRYGEEPPQTDAPAQ